MNGEAGPKAGPDPLHLQRNPNPQAIRRLSDEDLLEVVDRAYEYGAWAADMGMVDFDAFADLADVLGELRLRIAASGGAA